MCFERELFRLVFRELERRRFECRKSDCRGKEERFEERCRGPEDVRCRRENCGCGSFGRGWFGFCVGCGFWG